MAPPRFSIVTGANKGIGLAITRALATSGATVVLTARNSDLGRAAAESLSASVAGKVVFHPLDVTSSSSIAALADAVSSNAFGAGPLDALVCNAGWAAKGSAFTPDIARQSLDVNYKGVRDVSRALLPALRANPGGSQLVVVSSRSGNVGQIAADAPQRARLAATDLGQAELDRLADSFVEAVEAGGDLRGWPRTAYGVSKMAATAQVRLLAREEAAAGSGVVVSACCPGYVNTDMTSGRGHLTVEEGADTPVWLASGGAGTRSGGMWAERKELDFAKGW
eukprot:contig_18598_g4575